MSSADGLPVKRWVKTMPCKCGHCRIKPRAVRPRCPLIRRGEPYSEKDWLWILIPRGSG